MESRAILVTGTSTGIGRATAVHLASLGFRVLAGVRSDEDAASVRALAPDRIEPLILDVTDASHVAAAAERAAQAELFGLVNNAGVTVQGPVETLSADDFRRQLEINLVGPVALTVAVLPLLRAARGRVVMLSSIGGRMALPFVAPYHASKFALEAFSDSLRMEVEPLGVHVSVVEPGSVKTELWRKGEEAGESLLGSLSPAMRELYGARLEAMLEMAGKTAARGVEPVAVAEAIARALTARRPRTRYLVGADARVQAGMKAMLPDRALDRVTRRLTGT